MYLAVAMWADENDQRLPSSEPDDGQAGHRYLGQPGSEAYDAIADTVPEDTFICPSFGGAASFEPFYHAPGARWVWQAGTMYLGNLNTTGWPAEALETAEDLTDDPRLPVLACAVTQSEAHGFVNFGHGTAGGARIDGTASPMAVGCAGTVVMRLDGAGAFEQDLEPFQRYPGGFAEKLYLPVVD